jgi:ribonuclease HII
MARPFSLPADFDLAAFAAPVSGVDEAGRGPWAGPVVAAAVIFTAQEIPGGLNDSKKLTALVREKLFADIMKHDVGIGIASVEEIDALNIRRANHLAMQRAVAALSQKPKTILVDGNDEAAFIENEAIVQAIVGGDGLVPVISAASIIAKVTRDRLMHALSLEFPDYGWATNQGYGTASHAAALEKYGVTIHHRRTYAPIRRLLDQK